MFNTEKKTIFHTHTIKKEKACFLYRKARSYTHTLTQIKHSLYHSLLHIKYMDEKHTQHRGKSHIQARCFTQTPMKFPLAIAFCATIRKSLYILRQQKIY